MVMALIGPEVVVLWAMRQRYMAMKLKDEYKDRGWESEHAFFAIMGGFMFYDKDKPIATVRPKDFRKFSAEDFPSITSEEISDRSKGDVISKGLAIVQTGWFVLQCIGRRFQHLPITQMELATVAFAALNLMTYAFWWRKPLNVERPFRVQWKEEYGDESEEGEDKFNIWGVLRRGLLFPLIPFDRMARGDDHIRPMAKRVPTFYPGKSKKLFHWQGALAGIVVATIFGGIHCIAWNYQFLWTEPAPAAYDNTSNPAELFLWRIACLIITVFPVFIWGLAVIIEGLKSLDNHFAHAVSIIPVLAGGICGLLYVLARITLLVLAYKSLDVLPHEAYRDVYWTSFIPHV
jgi:hypothetical protein